MPKSAVSHLKIANHFPDPHFRLTTMRVPQHGATHEQHTHDFEELVVILDGHGKHEVGREVYDISAGDVFVLLGDVSHCYPEAKNLSLINILYDPANLRLPRADLGALPGYHALFEVEPRLRQRQRFQNRLQLGMDELGRLAKLIAELETELRANAPGSRFVATAHFLFSVYGLLTVMLVTLVGGVLQGLSQEDWKLAWPEVSAIANPFAVATTFAWSLILFSNIFFLVHLALMWLRWGCGGDSDAPPRKTGTPHDGVGHPEDAAAVSDSLVDPT